MGFRLLDKTDLRGKINWGHWRGKILMESGLGGGFKDSGWRVDVSSFVGGHLEQSLYYKGFLICSCKISRRIFSLILLSIFEYLRNDMLLSFLTFSMFQWFKKFSSSEH